MGGRASITSWGESHFCRVGRALANKIVQGM
jgi:hypothetical protein